MKKHVIAAAIAAAVAAPAAMAGAPTVYGQINMSLDSLDSSSTVGTVDTTDKAASGIKVTSNASRIGVKGSEDLGNGLKAIYKIEWGVSVDGTGLLSGRNQYVGVAGTFGAVLMGRHDTPMKMIQPTDTFNDGYGDNRWMAGGLGVNGGEVRASNVLAYVSPSFSGVKLIAAVVPNEGGYDDDNDGTVETSSGLTDIYSVALTYGSKKKGLYLAAAYNNWTDYGTIVNNARISSNPPQTPIAGIQGQDLSEVRVAVQYTAGALMGNIMYQDFDLSGTGSANALAGEGSNIQVNLAYTIGAATLKGKYSSVDYDGAGMKDGDAFGLGVDYALGKKTTAYVEYVASNKFNLYTTNGGLNAGDNNADSSAISVGLLHKF